MILPDIAYWNALHIICDLGYRDFRVLVQRFGSGERAWKSTPTSLHRLPLSPSARKNFPQRDSFSVEGAFRALQKTRVHCITILDEAYPLALKEIASPPPLLYYRGDISLVKRPCFAIVGSRRATPYGILATKKFSRELADCGFVIVSGMALGIDTVAHTAALEFDKKTIAVLGSGCDTASLYPAANQHIGERIAQHGLLLSEHPILHKPAPYDFPRRNRIVSGLSEGVLITEGREKSGALITARLALEQGKEVFALPGDVTRATSRGSNGLLKEGATPVQYLSDILEHFSLRPDIQKKLDARTPDTSSHPILTLLSDSPLSADAIAHALSQRIAHVQIELTQLEIAQKIFNKDGLYYRGNI